MSYADGKIPSVKLLNVVVYHSYFGAHDSLTLPAAVVTFKN
jgi:hypothetical protein